MSSLMTLNSKHHRIANHIFRCSSTSVPTVQNNNILPLVNNRNPRNLEKMRLARKPDGYHLEKHKVTFWHKLVLEDSKRVVTARLIHNTKKEVVTASTKEWAMRKFLYSFQDRTAYLILAKVFAERCLESGINYCYCDLTAPENTKVDLFLKTLVEEGLLLEEPKHFNIYDIWKAPPETKPWLITGNE